MTLSHHRHRSLLLKILDRHIHTNLNDPGSLSAVEKAEREELLEMQEQLTQAVYSPSASTSLTVERAPDTDPDDEEVEVEVEVEEDLTEDDDEVETEVDVDESGEEEVKAPVKKPGKKRRR